MLSFKSIAVFATLAFGALSALGAPVVDAHAAGAGAVAVHARDVEVISVAKIITTTTVQITPYVEELSTSPPPFPHSYSR